jgi:hypothetical protein
LRFDFLARLLAGGARELLPHIGSLRNFFRGVRHQLINRD